MAEGLLSWDEIRALADAGYAEQDVTRGPANAHTHTRLFDAADGTVPQIVLYRDKHHWCPYCEKVQLFLEAKRVPYQMKFVTMFCYGKKEAWYTQLVPSGMLPALSLTPRGPIVTESDDIMLALEAAVGPLQPGVGMGAAAVVAHRNLERKLFRAWCNWLCQPQGSAAGEQRSAAAFHAVATEVEAAVRRGGGPFMLGSQLSVADVVYAPYLGRMNASLFYYKGYNLRAEHTVLHQWFSALEGLEAYRGLISDFHTHAHDLPPQMGGCYAGVGDRAALAAAAAQRVDHGPFAAGLLGLQVDPVAYPEPLDAKAEAAWRAAKHAATVTHVNPHGAAATDVALRASLTLLLTGSLPLLSPSGSGAEPAAADVARAARYVRDRVSCPRDMPLHSAMRFRDALEAAASACGPEQSEPVALRNRYDSNPEPFRA
jgi:glutathione S-transferase